MDTATAGSSFQPSYALYVENLHPDVTDMRLFEKFLSIGPVHSVRVFRDMITRRSLGYGYVSFRQPRDAWRALETKGFDTINGRPFNISWSQQLPSPRKTNLSSVFIDNLQKGIDNKTLHDAFSPFGNILFCRILSDENGYKGYGIVYFETEEAAKIAIDKINSMLLDDKKIFVGRFLSGNDQLSKTHMRDEGADKQLIEILREHGTVVSASLITTYDGKGKGFGFVSFETSENAAEYMNDINGCEILNHKLYLDHAQSSAERQAELRDWYGRLKLDRVNRYQGMKLYLNNLDDDIDDERLRKEFSQYGNITSAKVMREEGGGASKGYGFVCFSAPEEATKAATEMNGHIIISKPLQVALAQHMRFNNMHFAVQHMQEMSGIHITPSASYPMVPFGSYYIPTMQQQHHRYYGQKTRASFGWATPSEGRLTFLARQRMHRLASSRQSRMSSHVAPQQQTGQDSPEAEKQMLGEIIYLFIYDKYPELAGKLTGMLLELDNSELLQMLAIKENLQSKMEEAVAVLKAAKEKKSASS